MPTATLPRSAQALVGAQRPTLAQVRLLRRVAIQDVEERSKLERRPPGRPGRRSRTTPRCARRILAFALGHFSDAEEAFAGSEAYSQALLGLIYHELGEHAEAKTNLAAAAKGLPEAKAELVRALLDGGQVDEAEKALANVPEGADREFLAGRLQDAAATSRPPSTPTRPPSRRSPEHVEAAFKLGVLLDRIGDDDMAVEYYLVCADVAPALPRGRDQSRHFV